MACNLHIDLTQELNKLKSTLFCNQCNSARTQRFACGHSFCPACHKELQKTKSCVECNETELFEDDCETNDYVLNTYNKIVSALTTNVAIINEAQITNEVLGHKIYLSAPFKCNWKGESPLHVACKNKQLEALRKYISNNYSLNCKDHAGWTPLHEAVESDFYDGVEALLEAGALCNVPGDLYVTPLHKAVMKSNNADNNYEIVKLLKKYGADINAMDYTCFTPLSISSDFVRGILQNDDDNNDVAIQSNKKLFIDKVVICVKDKQKKILNKFAKLSIGINNATHFVVKNEKNQHADMLSAILNGMFVTDTKWLDDFINSDGKLIVPNTGYYVENEHNQISVFNRLYGRPPLFHGINFYITGHQKGIVINDRNFTKCDLINFIKFGGGTLLARSPTPDTSTETRAPYHVNTQSSMKNCYNCIIYDENEPPQLQYNMPEIKHKSSKWLIECILSFKIL